MLEWKLPSEPWLFVIDRTGLVQAKFEGVATEDEIAAAIMNV